MSKDLKSIKEDIEKLTKKESGFIKDYIKTGNATKAVLNNYDTKDKNVAGAIGSENLRKPKIQKIIKSIADKIPDNKLLEVHLEGLEATKVSYIRKLTPDGPEDIEEPDYAVRHKYLESGYKLKGLYVDKIGNPDGTPLQPTVIFIPQPYSSNE